MIGPGDIIIPIVDFPFLARVKAGDICRIDNIDLTYSPPRVFYSKIGGLDVWVTYRDSTFNYNFAVQSCCGGSGHIRWSTTDKQWTCTDCGSIKSNDPNYYWSPKNGPDSPVYPTWTSKKCECGSEKTYGVNTGHTSWCPKYIKT